MTDNRAGPPIKKEAATQGSEPGQPRDFGCNTNAKYTTAYPPGEILSVEEKRRLQDLALDILPLGTLRRYLPFSPAWCRRIGRDVLHAIGVRRLDHTEIWQLQDAYSRAIAKLEEACKAGDRSAWKARACLQRQKHDVALPPRGGR